MRIVSLLPSTTEILFDLGAGPEVVGVTFECDHPAEARTRTIVSSSAIPPGLDPAGIDRHVAEAMRRGKDLYHLDEGALAGLDADLVVTQDLCAVCAVDVSVVDDALAHLGCTARVLTVDPHTLEEVFGSVELLGDAVGRVDEAAALAASLRDRLARLRAPVAGRTRPRVAVLEWADPPYAPGHWVPELVEAAGGEPAIGDAGRPSLRTSWAAIAESAPEVVVVAPCGLGLPEATAEARRVLPQLATALPGVPVWAVDANGSYARPGPRLVDGAETLARILHPACFEEPPDPTAAELVSRG